MEITVRDFQRSARVKKTMKMEILNMHVSWSRKSSHINYSLLGKIRSTFVRLPFFGCVSGRLVGVSAENPEMSSPLIPLMLFRHIKASPAKSLLSIKSWSITVKCTQAPCFLHCLTETELQANIHYYISIQNIHPGFHYYWSKLHFQFSAILLVLITTHVSEGGVGIKSTTHNSNDSSKTGCKLFLTIWVCCTVCLGNRCGGQSSISANGSLSPAKNTVALQHWDVAAWFACKWLELFLIKEFTYRWDLVEWYFWHSVLEQQQNTTFFHGIKNSPKNTPNNNNNKKQKQTNTSAYLQLIESQHPYCSKRAHLAFQTLCFSTFPANEIPSKWQPNQISTNIRASCGN